MDKWIGIKNLNPVRIGMRIEIINENEDEEFKILHKYDPLSSLKLTFTFLHSLILNPYTLTC